MHPYDLVPGLFASDRAKWAWLETAPETDRLDPVLIAFADHIMSIASHRQVGTSPIGPRWLRAELCAAIARDGIHYETDTERVGHEQLGTPAAAWSRGVDDCDAKARLFVALALLCGLRARLVPLWRGETLYHVYAEVWLPTSSDTGSSYPVELTLSRARIGDMPRSVPKEIDGKWLTT